jgi:hypothetical protein
MIHSNSSHALSSVLRTALLAVGCTLGAALLQPAVGKAADLHQLDDKAPSLPLSATFDKVSGTEGGPYVLKLKNTSSDSLSVSGKVVLAVPFHGNTKERPIAAHLVEAGQTWSISDLSAGDKVTLTAMGFAPLELAVP